MKGVIALNKLVEIKDLFEIQTAYITPLFENHTYPWEVLPGICDYVNQLAKDGIEGFTQISENILIGKDVKIHPSATIIPPAIIGAGTEIRTGAFLRGNVITGENCVIGNSSELKNCILLNKAQVPHYNYVGDSILGNHAHMGAGSICSNLKSDGKAVVIHGECEYETGLRKVGAILADGADIGCGCVLNPGTVVGKNTSVYPLTSLRGVYPLNSIVKDSKTVVNRV